MSNDTTFTPGPWVVCDTWYASLIAPANDTKVCIAQTGNWLVNEKSEQEANARLIAAAPALYEALSRLSAVAEMTTFSDSYPAECEAARAALQSVKEG